MVQIVEHRAETLVDLVVEEEDASSTPQVPNRFVPGTAAVHATGQHTAVQTSRTLSRVAPGALSVARELLRHPKLYGLARGHEAMAGQRRLVAQYGCKCNQPQVRVLVI
jgi:hypothetical protein